MVTHDSGAVEELSKHKFWARSEHSRRGEMTSGGGHYPSGLDHGATA